jgi:hypothetical protein
MLSVLRSLLLSVFFLELLGNGLEVVRRINLITKCSPRFLLHKAIQTAQGVRLDEQLDDETEGHGHHPGYKFATLRRKITVESRLLRMSHDLLECLGLIVAQENRDKYSLIWCHISISFLVD